MTWPIGDPLWIPRPFPLRGFLWSANDYLYVSLVARIRETRVAESSEPLDLSERRSIDDFDFRVQRCLQSWTPINISLDPDGKYFIISLDPDGKGR